MKTSIPVELPGKLKHSEWLAVALVCAGVFFLVGMIFFRHPLAGLLLSCAGLACPGVYRKAKHQRRMQQKSFEYKQALEVLSASLTAGQSVENSLRNVHHDLERSFPDLQDVIARFRELSAQLDNSVPAEEALYRMAAQTGLSDIRQFAEVFAIGKRSGGNLVELIRKAVVLLGDKASAEQEISVLLARKRLESRVLIVVPPGFIGFLGWSSPEYMSPLYEGTGRLIMAGALTILILCIWVCRKIADIRI